MNRLPIVALLLCASCLAERQKVESIDTLATQDHLGIWVRYPDSWGNEHLLFCTARGLYESAVTPPACYDFTPTNGQAVGPIAIPYAEGRAVVH